jgi:hypothetical protein
MEEMIDICNCPCGATIGGELELVPLQDKRKPGLHQIQCRRCGRRGVIASDIDTICGCWNNDFPRGEVTGEATN